MIKRFSVLMIWLCIAFSGLSQKNGIFTSLDKAMASPDSVIELKLTYDGLKDWPEELQKFPNLKVLNLSHNKLDTIPSNLEYLSGLIELNLTANKIDSLSIGFTKLKSLKVLKLGNNEIYHVSHKIAEMQNLEYLELWSNNINYLPLQIYELPNLLEVDMRGMMMSEHNQEAIKNLFKPEVKLKFSSTCHCN